MNTRQQSTNTIIVCGCGQRNRKAFCLDPSNGNKMTDFVTPSSANHASQTSSSEFVVCGDHGKLSVGSMTTGTMLRSMTGHGGKQISCVATIPSVPNRVATGGDDHMIVVWDVAAESSVPVVARLRGHSDEVYQLHHHPILFPTMLFSSSGDKTVREWDLTKQRCLRVFSGHTNEISGLCLDSKHQILFSGSIDKTVKGWDLRSGERICSLDLFSNWIQTLLCREDSAENQLIVPVLQSEVNIFDLRVMIQQSGTTSEIISWDHGHLGSIFGSCDVPDHGYFVTAGQIDNQVKAWRSDGTCVWDWKSPNLIYGAAPFVNEFVSLSPRTVVADQDNDIIRSLEVVKKFDQLTDFRLRCDSSSPPYELPASRALLSSSPYILRTTIPESLSLDRSYPLIDEEGLFSVLFGSTPSPETLSQYYSLFRELRLFGFAFAMCELIKSTVTADQLEQLVSDCAFQEEEGSGENVFAELTPFELELLHHIHDLKKDLRKSLLLRLYQLNSMVAIAALLEGVPSFRDHEDFLDLSPTERSSTVAEAAKKNACSLRTLAKQTNVTLTTADGGEERCHLEVLITRSKFIRGMMRFEGAEYHSYLETKTIRIEDMSHAALQAWLVLCYGSEFHEIDQLSIYDLLSLLIKSHVHQEDWCNRIVTLLRAEIEKKEATEIPSLLLEIGVQLLSLPEDLRNEVLGIVRRRYGSFRLEFGDLAKHTLSLAQKVKDLVYENERLRKELEQRDKQGDED